MHPEAKEQLRVWFKLKVLEYGKILGATEACKDFNVAGSSYYYWKGKFDSEGKAGLYRKKPVAYTHPKKTKPEVVEKILELRTVYKMGALRIKYYLERYHGIKISESTVTRTLVSNGLRENYLKLQIDVLCIQNAMQNRFQATTYKLM